MVIDDDSFSLLPRYEKQIVLPEIGIEGQKKLLNAKVLCVGAGGLGSPSLIYLAAAGIGLLGIIDHDRVEMSNLHRQILFSMKNVGQAKVSAAATHLLELNSEISIREYSQYLSAENALDIMKEYDIIIDATDNFATKYLINDAAVKLSKPVIYGAISGFSGQVSVFWSAHGPCYRCLFPKAPKNYVPNCAESGTLGAIAGIIGCMQAMEVIKIILGKEHCAKYHLETLIGRLYCLDLTSIKANTLTIEKRRDCHVCGLNRGKIVLSDGAPLLCEKNIAVKTLSLKEAMQQKNIVFIDVREPHEWRDGIIDHAIRLPLSTLENSQNPFHSLALTEHYVVYCQHGIRSLRVVKKMGRLGFKNVSHLKGGLAGA